MTGKNALLWGIAGLLLAAVCAVAVYRAWPLLFPNVEISAALNPDCDLRVGPCVTTLDDGGRVSLSIEPREIPVMMPLRLRVKLEDVAAEAVAIDFKGADMNMGFNRVKLAQSGEGEFTGQGTLPVCVRDAMEWEARVLISRPDGLLSVPYRFITVRPGAATP
jgi:hypothetical protein